MHLYVNWFLQLLRLNCSRAMLTVCMCRTQSFKTSWLQWKTETVCFKKRKEKHWKCCTKMVKKKSCIARWFLPRNSAFMQDSVTGLTSFWLMDYKCPALVTSVSLHPPIFTYLHRFTYSILQKWYLPSYLFPPGPKWQLQPLDAI